MPSYDEYLPDKRTVSLILFIIFVFGGVFLIVIGMNALTGKLGGEGVHHPVSFWEITTPSPVDGTCYLVLLSSHGGIQVMEETACKGGKEQ